LRWHTTTHSPLALSVVMHAHTGTHIHTHTHTHTHSHTYTHTVVGHDSPLCHVWAMGPDDNGQHVLVRACVSVCIRFSIRWCTHSYRFRRFSLSYLLSLSLLFCLSHSQSLALSLPLVLSLSLVLSFSLCPSIIPSLPPSFARACARSRIHTPSLCYVPISRTQWDDSTFTTCNWT